MEQDLLRDIIIPFTLIFLVFYFLIVRPKQKENKAHEVMISSVKKGDEVVTLGGLIGKASKVSENEITIDFGNDINIKALKSALRSVKPK